MSGLQEINNGKNHFFPKLLDCITPTQGDFNDVFLVMEQEETDLRLLMKSGNSLSFGKDHVKTILYNIFCAANFL